MKLNDKIWVCRKKAGLSQEALAEKIGVSRQAISKWETGEAAPEISKLPLLARTFGVTADWLLDDEAEFEEDAPEEEVSPEAEAQVDRPAMQAVPVQAWPSWVEHLPGFLGRMVKKFGWLFGVRMAISGALFTAMGFVAKAMFSSMDRIASDGFQSVENMAMNGFNAIGGYGSGVTFYDNAGNVIDPNAWGIDVSQFGLGSGTSFGLGNFSVSTGMSQPFDIFCGFIILVGLVMLIGGGLLAWYLKKWGEKSA